MNTQHSKKIGFFVALLVFVLSMPHSAMAQIGFSAGYNFNRLSDINLDNRGESSFENAAGWHAELWFDMEVGSLALRPGLRYMAAGSIFEFANDANPSLRDNFNINLFEIPIDLRFRFNMEILTPFITVGPVLRFPSGARDEIDGMNNVSIGGGFGFGIELDFGLFMVYPEMKYTFGLSKFTADEFQIADIPFSTTDNQLLNGVMLRIGIGLR